MPKQPHFSPNLFRFLRRLKKNNRREWFRDNKDVYMRDVRDPMLRFVSDFAPQLAKISPHFVADPRPVGGSLFRIYRDVRFSKDKSPYKTMAAVQFRHEDGKDVHAPGFYLHLEPGLVFAGCGLWHPDSQTLRKVRDAIVDDPSRWKGIIHAAGFKNKNLALSGESLKKPPRGYDPEHRFVEDLKRKDFVVSANFTEKDACAPDFLTRFSRTCRQAAAFNRFLTEAVGLPF
jgi:uncharacterized protein (TIGR02453 family)